jgi:hypothetical protein
MATSGISNPIVTTPANEKIEAMRVTGLTQLAFAITGAIATIGAPPVIDRRNETNAAT